MSLYDNSITDNDRQGMSQLVLRAAGVLLTVLYTLHHYLTPNLQNRGWMELLCWPAMLIFCFLLAEGMLRTQDKWLYLMRVLLFALIAEIPYDLLNFGYYVSTDGQNVLFSILLCWCLLYAIDYIRLGTDNLAATVVAELVCAAAGGRIAALLDLEMGRFAVLACVICYISVRVTYSGLFRLLALGLLCLRFQQDALFSLALFGRSLELPVQAAALPALLLIHLYRGKRGPNSLALRYASYLFYPALIGLTLYLKLQGVKL
jgi:hypothetical protein